jgi:type I restriction enzyme S subunit
VIEADWLEEFPPAWPELRADFLCNPYRVTVSPDQYEGDMVAHYSIPQVQETGGPIIEPADDIDSTKLLISRPTLLVSKLNPRKRTICIAEPQGDLVTLASGEFVPIQSDQFDQRYGYYVWLSEKVTDRLSAIVQSATRSHQRVNPSDILKLPWKWPPLETQKRIATFLDEKTAQIDALIARKQALLARLAEKRQAIITQAVTKGLNPAAPMKDSSIDWLGQIPAHWDIWPLKRVLATSAYGISASLEPTGNVAILRMGNLQNGELDFSDLRYLDEIETGLLLKKDDVVFNRTNSLDLVGKAAIYRGNYEGQLSLASYLVLFRFDERYDPAFANYVMRTDVLMALGRTLALPSIGQANLNPNRYAAIYFPIPPINEQIDIAAYIAAQLSSLSEAETQIISSVGKLAEYRSALITSAVTGQIEGLR